MKLPIPISKSAIVLSAALFCYHISFSQEFPQLPQNLEKQEAVLHLNSYGFQGVIRGASSLGELAQAHSALGEQAIQFGFAEKSETAKFYIIGALYSEAVAYLRSGNLDLAAKRLKSIEKEFINLEAPPALFNYLSKVRNALEIKKYSAEMTGELLSLLQPFLEDYAKSRGQDKLILFQAGSWMVDISLAAAAGVTFLLNQSATLNYFYKELKQMDAPKGVLEAMEEMMKVMEKKDITDQDAQQVLQLVKRIQTILG